MNIKAIDKINIVNKSARLVGVSGSVTARERLASNLCKKLYLRSRESLLKNSCLDVKEIEAHLESLGKNITFNVLENKDPETIGAISLVHEKFAPHSVWGYIMDLPLVSLGNNMTLPKSRIGTFFHEARHFFDYITQPKRVASAQRFESLGQMLKHWDFYKNHLYVEKESFENADDVLNNLKVTLNTHFEALKTPVEERITVLQDFRYRLGAELNAGREQSFFLSKNFYDETRNKIKRGETAILNVPRMGLSYDSRNYSGKTQKQLELKKIQMAQYSFNVKHVFGEPYLFEGKIKILEEMIYEDIMKVRAVIKEQVADKELQRQYF